MEPDTTPHAVQPQPIIRYGRARTVVSILAIIIAIWQGALVAPGLVRDTIAHPTAACLALATLLAAVFVAVSTFFVQPQYVGPYDTLPEQPILASRVFANLEGKIYTGGRFTVRPSCWTDSRHFIATIALLIALAGTALALYSLGIFR